MATKRKKAVVQVFPSTILPNGHQTIQYGDHIIGVIHEGKNVTVKRVKLERAEDGRPLYAVPIGELAKPFETPKAAADAVLAEWLKAA